MGKAYRLSNIDLQGFFRPGYDEYHKSSTPERFLFTAIFERAYRDLYENDLKTRRDAYYWFTSRIDYDPDCITFRQIKDELKLSQFVLRKIEARLSNWEQYVGQFQYILKFKV